MRMWALKGHQPEISTYGVRKRMHIIGTIDPFGGVLCVGLSDSLQADQFIHFLALLSAIMHARKKFSSC